MNNSESELTSASASASAPIIEESGNIKSKPQIVLETKNMQYRNILYNSAPATQATITAANLDSIIEKEMIKNASVKKTWNKLNKTQQITKLIDYANRKAKENKYTEPETQLLIAFFRSALHANRLKHIKDVIYDADNEVVKDIPNLYHNTHKNCFTLREHDKHTSTVKSTSKIIT